MGSLKDQQSNKLREIVTIVTLTTYVAVRRKWRYDSCDLRHSATYVTTYATVRHKWGFVKMEQIKQEINGLM